LRDEFIEGWIPWNYYLIEVLPVVNGGYKFISAYKTLTNRILQTNSIPDIGYLIHGEFYSNHFEVIDKKDVKERYFEKGNTIFFKKNIASKGKGIILLHENDFNLSKVETFGDGCFQSQIIQHKFFDDINTSSTATIRLITIKKPDGIVSSNAAYLRISRDNDDWVKSSSNIRIPIDIMTGKLLEFGFTTNWIMINKHPYSNFEYYGKQIPFFDTAKKECQKLHESFPQFSVIGWDLCIDIENKVKIMEWNTSQNHIVLPEATTGPIFKELLWENLWKKT